MKMERWPRALLAVLGTVFLAPIRGEECTLDGARGVLAPASQCATFAEQAIDAADGSPANDRATVCCPVFQSEPSCGRVSQYDGTFSHDSRETQLDQFPWAAVVSYRWSSNKVCSGSLITREFVLSAAHCFNQRRRSLIPQQYRVRLGDWDLNADNDCRYVRGRLVCNEHPPVVIPVRTVVCHQRYDRKRRDFLHDIALLQLERPAAYGALIGPVCLPPWSRRESEAIVGRNFTATGWGLTRSFAALQRKLKLTVRGLNMSVCARAYSMPAPEVAQVQLCIGGARRRDVCYGDSGGALMRREEKQVSDDDDDDDDDDGRNRWTQVGIISFGANRCDQGFPGVYTNVAYYVDWIQRVIQLATGNAIGVRAPVSSSP